MKLRREKKAINIVLYCNETIDLYPMVWDDGVYASIYPFYFMYENLLVQRDRERESERDKSCTKHWI